jgi:hypothetical protein
VVLRKMRTACENGFLKGWKKNMGEREQGMEVEKE